MSAKVAESATGSESPTKKTRSQTNAETSGKKSDSAAPVKKETFQWSTPADEFAEDVESDDSEDGDSDYIDEDGHPNDGSIVINLGVDEAEKFSMSSASRSNGEKFVGRYDPEEQRRLREEAQGYEYYPKSEGGRRSKKSKHKEKFPCPKCDKVWNWPWELRRHLVMHFKEKERQDATMFKCDECGKGFQWKRDLAQHKRLHTGEKLLICSVCGKKFTTRQALLHHVVVHTGEKPFQCAQCGNRFTQPANLRTHMKKKHDGVAMKNKCPHCQENFPSVVAVHQHILEDHQNIVAEEREVQAMEKIRKEEEKAIREKAREEARKRREAKRKERMDLNDFKIKGLKEWEINYEFHIGDGIVRGVDWDRTPSNGELICEICDRKFGWRYEIMFHNLCHQFDESGSCKNRVCPECETVFKVPIGLKHHLLTHTGELPFLCLHCWRSFASHIDLKLHLRREHLFHLDVPSQNTTPVVSKKKLKEDIFERKVRVTPKMESSTTETVRLVMTDENGQHYTTEETQTIILGADGTIMNHNNQDMIVVIQSDDFDQSQGLIVVDPSQIQHVVGADGVRSTTVTTADGTTMILGSSSAGNEDDDEGGQHTGQSEIIVSDQTDQNGQTTTTQYINVQFSDEQDIGEEDEDEDGAGQDSTAVGSTILQLSGDHHFESSEGSRYVVVSSGDSKMGLQLQQVNNSSSGMVEGGESQELLLHEQHQEGEEGTHGRQESGNMDSKSGIIMQYQIIGNLDSQEGETTEEQLN